MADLYFILGAQGSGRLEVLFDLLRQPRVEEVESPIAICVSESEPPPSPETPMGTLAGVDLHVWRREAERAVLPPPDVLNTYGTVFIVFDGTDNPVDQIEALRAWLDEAGHRLARILTVVDCTLLASQPGAVPWYEACIHFSDVVLLNRREGAPNKWIKDYHDTFSKACHPGLFEFVKKGRVANPVRILFPEARRLSLIFDDEAERETESADDSPVYDLQDVDEEDADTTAEPDPYLARKPGGFRCKPIPDIREFLDARHSDE